MPILIPPFLSRCVCQMEKNKMKYVKEIYSLILHRKLPKK